MLSPKYLEGMPERMVELYAQAETDILADMARRISAYDYFIPAAEHQLRMLEEMGAEQDYVFDRLAELTGKSERELVRLFEEAGRKASSSDAEIYRRAGREPPDMDTSPALQDRLNAGLRQTQQEFANLTRSTARGAYSELGQALDRAWMQITSGGMDTDTAVRSAVKWLSARGVDTVDYDSGYRNSVEAAVRRATVTGINQTCLKLQWELADLMNSDLVEVTAHAGARPSHAVWQGGIYSRSGKSKKYPAFVKATGYGTGAGLGGWNCRHSFYPYFEGTPRTWTGKALAALNEKTIEYNGERMTEYEASQKQRYIERQIRRWKREQAAMQAAGLPMDEAEAKVREWQEKQRDFTRQTGFKRQYNREQIANSTKSAIMKAKTGKNGEKLVNNDQPAYRSLGELNADYLEKRFGKLQTKELIIMDERLEHIRQRHPEDIELFEQYGAASALEPDIVVVDEKHEGTVFMIKRLPETNLNVVTRLALDIDDAGRKNSIMTFYRIRDKNLQKIVKKSEVLYKKE